MSALTENVQTIMENGKPAFAVIPYDQYKLICKKIDSFELQEDEVPHELVGLILEKSYNPVKAWRVYLRMSQSEAAKKIGISQAALSQIEKTEHNQKATLQKIAKAYGIHVGQLDV